MKLAEASPDHSHQVYPSIRFLFSTTPAGAVIYYALYHSPLFSAFQLAHEYSLPPPCIRMMIELPPPSSFAPRPARQFHLAPLRLTCSYPFRGRNPRSPLSLSPPLSPMVLVNGIPFGISPRLPLFTLRPHPSNLCALLPSRPIMNPPTFPPIPFQFLTGTTLSLFSLTGPCFLRQHINRLRKILRPSI